MREKTTKYTNLISVFFILLSAFLMIFLIPNNQISISTINYNGILYIIGLIGFIVLVIVIFYYLPMIFIINYSYYIHLPYISNKRVKLIYNCTQLTIINRNKYQQLCVVRC